MTGPAEPLALGTPEWGEPQRRTPPPTAVAGEASTDDVDRLLARREARAVTPDVTDATDPSPSAVDDLLARRAARAVPAPSDVENASEENA